MSACHNALSADTCVPGCTCLMSRTANGSLTISLSCSSSLGRCRLRLCPDDAGFGGGRSWGLLVSPTRCEGLAAGLLGQWTAMWPKFPHCSQWCIGDWHGYGRCQRSQFAQTIKNLQSQNRLQCWIRRIIPSVLFLHFHEHLSCPTGRSWCCVPIDGSDRIDASGSRTESPRRPSGKSHSSCRGPCGRCVVARDGTVT